MSYAPRLRLLRTRLARVRSATAQLDIMQAAMGRMESRMAALLSSDDIHANEFRAYSQFGEDGILQWLLRRTPGGPRTFVEFGVQNYVESNTRNLLINDHWAGLVIDGSRENIEYIRSDPVYGRYGLRAECAFITRDNINALIAASGLSGDIGLLSIDIDGNDYWVWKAIDVVSPRILVCEYNSIFGPHRRVTVPYDAAFVRERAHYSHLYFGASLAALASLATERGYSLVGCTSSGNNAFFVRKDIVGTLPVLTPAAAYRPTGARESRDPAGNFTFLELEAGRQLIAAMPLHDLDTNGPTTVGALPPLGIHVQAAKS